LHGWQKLHSRCYTYKFEHDDFGNKSLSENWSIYTDRTTLRAKTRLRPRPNPELHRRHWYESHVSVEKIRFGDIFENLRLVVDVIDQVGRGVGGVGEADPVGGGHVHQGHRGHALEVLQDVVVLVLEVAAEEAGGGAEALRGQGEVQDVSGGGLKMHHQL
jgi:hypothetical protein